MKFRRPKWVITFWLFWKSVKAVLTTKVEFVLIHMDDKWFYVVRFRTNCKMITSIEDEPNDYFTQYKNHIEKQIYIVVTAFVLNDNDIEKGRTLILICETRIRGFIKKIDLTITQKYKIIC